MPKAIPIEELVLTNDQKKMVDDNRGLLYAMAEKTGDKFKLSLDEMEEMIFAIGVKVLMRATQIHDPKRTKFSTYVCGALIKNYNGWVQQDRYKGSSQVGDEPWYIPADELENRNLKELINRELDRLPHVMRNAIIQKVVNGKTNAAIGKEFHCSRESIRQWCISALCIMKVRIQMSGYIL